MTLATFSNELVAAVAMKLHPTIDCAKVWYVSIKYRAANHYYMTYFSDYGKLQEPLRAHSCSTMPQLLDSAPGVTTGAKSCMVNRQGKFSRYIVYAYMLLSHLKEFS